MDLGKGSFWLVSWSGSPSGGDAEARRELDVQLARLVRFGAAGSPMPGHEWLTLQEVSDVVAFVHTLTGEDASASKGTAAAGGLAAPPRRIATAAAEPLRRRTASPSPAGGPTPRFHAAGLVAASWPAAALAGLALLGLGAAAFTGWLAPPRPWREATGWADIPAAERAPVSAAPWPAGTAAGPPPRLTWLGHAGFLVEWEGTRLLLDPNSSARCTVARRVLAERVDPGELGRVDAALISHAHYDHLDLATLAAVPELAAVVVPAGSERYLAALDPEVRRVGLRPGERFRVGSLEVVAVPAQHNGHRFHPLASGHGAAGYVVRGSRSALFYAGDTGYGPHLAAIGARWRPRLAILPIGAFAPRVPLRRYHLSPEEAVRAADDLGAEVVVPAHFGTYRLSLDAPDAALPRFAAAAAAAGQRWVLAPPPEGGG
jgi:L-ascorbate metabolism protein UlaG (beta-lactamase superfamily)